MNDFLKIRKAKWWDMWSVDWIENGFKDKKKTQSRETREEVVELAIITQLANPHMGIQTRDKVCRALMLSTKQARTEEQAQTRREHLLRIPVVARKRCVAVCDLDTRAKNRVRKQRRMRAIWRTWLRWQTEQIPDRTRVRMGKTYNWPAWLVNEALNLATTDAKKAYKDVQEER